MSNLITIMMGIPGSGKSTWIDQNLPEVSTICSADSYFITGTGRYVFDPSKLNEAHGECLLRFIDCLPEYATLNDSSDMYPVVVDNTNTTIEEIAPYIALARAHGVEPVIVHIKANPGVAAARNVHGVPADKVLAMHERLKNTIGLWPLYWPKPKVVET